jgi:hypothetical protein
LRARRGAQGEARSAVGVNRYEVGDAVLAGNIAISPRRFAPSK